MEYRIIRIYLLVCGKHHLLAQIISTDENLIYIYRPALLHAKRIRINNRKPPNIIPDPRLIFVRIFFDGLIHGRGGGGVLIYGRHLVLVIAAERASLKRASVAAA